MLRSGWHVKWLTASRWARSTREAGLPAHRGGDHRPDQDPGRHPRCPAASGGDAAAGLPAGRTTGIQPDSSSYSPPSLGRACATLDEGVRGQRRRQNRDSRISPRGRSCQKKSATPDAVAEAARRIGDARRRGRSCQKKPATSDAVAGVAHSRSESLRSAPQRLSSASELPGAQRWTPPRKPARLAPSAVPRTGHGQPAVCRPSATALHGAKYARWLCGMRHSTGGRHERQYEFACWCRS